MKLRKEKIILEISQDERDYLLNAAERANLSLVDFVLLAILALPAANKEPLRDIKNE